MLNGVQGNINWELLEVYCWTLKMICGSRDAFWLESTLFDGEIFNVLWPQYNMLNSLIKAWWLILFSCDQAALWTPLSVCRTVRPSVCLSVTPFSLCSCHRIITKFSGVITNDRSNVHAKGYGHKSKVKVTELITQLSRFRTVTPVWIHIWWWNDA